MQQARSCVPTLRLGACESSSGTIAFRGLSTPDPATFPGTDTIVPMFPTCFTPSDPSTLRPLSHRCFMFVAWALLGAAVAGCASKDPGTTSAARESTTGESTRALATDAARRGHSHNDYTRTIPLTTALESGMGSVEADIFLVDGELLVAHDRKDLRKDRTLASMYLDPLAARARERGGHIYGPGERPLILLVDIKADGPKVYGVLHEQLKARAELFTEFSGGKVTPRAVTVIISGSCPRAEIERQQVRWAFVDGRVTDLDGAGAAPTTLVPLISDSWASQFSWNGQGEMPAEQSARLRDLVQRAHARGHIIRFWGTPATDATWLAQLRAGVDLINMDEVARGAAFLRANAVASPF